MVCALSLFLRRMLICRLAWHDFYSTLQGIVISIGPLGCEMFLRFPQSRNFSRVLLFPCSLLRLSFPKTKCLSAYLLSSSFLSASPVRLQNVLKRIDNCCCSRPSQVYAVCLSYTAHRLIESLHAGGSCCLLHDHLIGQVRL